VAGFVNKERQMKSKGEMMLPVVGGPMDGKLHPCSTDFVSFKELAADGSTVEHTYRRELMCVGWPWVLSFVETVPAPKGLEITIP
jgi:hypothetical protein